MVLSKETKLGQRLLMKIDLIESQRLNLLTKIRDLVDLAKCDNIVLNSIFGAQF
jgi:hypothetical protein